MKKLTGFYTKIIISPWALFVFGVNLGLDLEQGDSTGTIIGILSVAFWVANRWMVKQEEKKASL
jgi:hypothetical protein